MRRLAVLLSFLALPSLFAVSPTYQVTRKFTLGGEGWWDYVVPDPPRHRLFIGRQNRVMVVNERNGKLLGAVLGVDGAHGVALDPHTGRGFATSGNDGTIVMFDLKSLKPLARIPAAEDADAILYDSASDRVFSFNGDAHSATVVDPAAGKLVTNIPLGGKPESGASTGDGKVYVNIEGTNEIAEIDAAALKVTRRWSTDPCERPVSMAVDVVHHRLFSGCRSGVMAVSDYDKGTVVATVPIGQGVDGAAYDPETGDVFTSNGDGTLTVIHQDGPDKYHVVENVKTMPGARTMGLDLRTHQLFLVSARFGPMPAATPDNRRRRPPMVPGSFTLLVVERTPKTE